jgi:hypothetical protein
MLSNKKLQMANASTWFFRKNAKAVERELILIEKNTDERSIWSQKKQKNISSLSTGKRTKKNIEPIKQPGIDKC